MNEPKACAEAMIKCMTLTHDPDHVNSTQPTCTQTTVNKSELKNISITITESNQSDTCSRENNEDEGISPCDHEDLDESARAIDSDEKIPLQSTSVTTYYKKLF